MTITACDQCGQRHERVSTAGRTLPTCKAHKADGAPCTNWAVKGAAVCAQRHGGRAPAVRAKAAARVATARAMRLVDLTNVGPCTDPVGALLGIAGQNVALVDILRRVVSELEEVSYRGGIGKGQEQVRGELQAYLQAMQQAERILSRIIALDLESRRVAIDSRRIDTLEAAVMATFTELRLDAETVALAKEVLRRELTARIG